MSGRGGLEMHCTLNTTQETVAKLVFEIYVDTRESLRLSSECVH